jgi:hypothetical protein
MTQSLPDPGPGTLPAVGPAAADLGNQAEVFEPPGSPQAGPARRAGDLVIAVARGSRAVARGVIGLGVARTVAPNSVTAISLLLALCAAAWISGGTSADYLRGLLALTAWASARVGARQLNTALAERPKPAQPRPARKKKPARPRTDWLVLPGYDWSPAEPARAAAPPITKPREGERSFGWLFEVSTVAAECAVYGGIAAGGEAAGWTGTWPLAIVTVVMVSIAEVAATCARAKAGPAPARSGSWVRTVLAAVLPPPVALRVLIAALAMVAYGPRIALFTVLAVEVIALVRALASLVELRPAQDQVSSPRGTLAAASAGQDVLLACRDDGPLALWAGRLVQGNLAPLAPALLGLASVVLLTALGLHGLPGIIALTPAVVLLLAAPGSSHPHDGRFDWLVPVLICLGQYSYLAALGLASEVSGPAIFATTGMVAVWYASLIASPAVQASVGGPVEGKVLTSRAKRIKQITVRRADGLGWEARICLAGLTAMFGIATFGYLGLAVFLAALMCRKAVIGYLIPAEDQPTRKDRRQ